jgi:IstB-like ATP binding protein
MTKTKPGERLPFLLAKLKAPGVLERLEQTATRAREQEWPYERFLETLLEAEVFARHAAFPAIKTLEDFDWSAQPTPRSRSCSTSRSSPGSRSAPTSASSAHPAPAKRTSRSPSRSRPTSAATASPSPPPQEWVSRLEAAQDRNQLEQELRRLERYQLVVVDEVGYLPLERQAANLLFALVSRRYERGSIIITSNRGFEQSGEILGDAMVAAALIDRLVHHATMTTLKGKS